MRAGMDLTLTDLNVARGGVPVLEGVTLRVPPGAALVLQGPNGAGKTTLLRTIAGLQPPLGGQIDGAEDRVAYAGHLDGIKPTLSVRENLGFWAQVFGQTDISAALSGFELTGLAARPAGALSAGQKRRLGLARLLVSARPVWVLDEPTVSLDRASVALFVRAVQGHLQAGGLAVMATHIDLGLQAETLDVAQFRGRAPADEAFL